MIIDNKTSRLLWHLLLCLLFVPVLQQLFHWHDFDALEGYNKQSSSDPSWTWAGWNATVYQKDKEQYRLENFGYRPALIRLNNQLDYSLFKYSNVDNVVIGKKNYLFGSDYIKAYTGQNFVGVATVEAKIQRFKRIQDTLDQMGKHLVMVVTPNKADFFENYLPSSAYEKGRQASTNYKAYLAAMQKFSIHHIDFNHFFSAAKDTLAYPAFPKTGVHLTPYATAVFTDTLIRYFEHHLQQDLPDFRIANMQWTDSASFDETDAENALNLILELTPKRFMRLQPSFNYRQKYQPNVLAIGDSFYWNFLALRSDKYLFHQHRFLYYNKEAFPGGPVNQLDLGEEIDRAEVILLVNSAFNLWRFCFDFDLDLYIHFFGDELRSQPLLFDQIVQEKIMTAQKNLEWMHYIRSQMKAGETEEQVVYNNVAYLLRKKLDRLHPK